MFMLKAIYPRTKMMFSFQDHRNEDLKTSNTVCRIGKILRMFAANEKVFKLFF